MPTIPDPPVFIVASELPNDLSIFLGIIILAATAVIIHCASPKRLTDILIVAIAKLKKTSSDAFEAGRLSASEIEKLRLLKHKVSTIQAETVDNSCSYLKTICGFIKGRTFTVLFCIWEVEDLEMHIKIQLLTPQPATGAVDNAQSVGNGGGGGLMIPRSHGRLWQAQTASPTVTTTSFITTAAGRAGGPANAPSEANPHVLCPCARGAALASAPHSATRGQSWETRRPTAVLQNKTLCAGLSKTLSHHHLLLPSSNSNNPRKNSHGLLNSRPTASPICEALFAPAPAAE
ncbi:hypothetical protein B0H19DRAFT_1251904 [Mycena capillaripes]|nr:hypothetical protein B0H19DRAFT_1251904 [Mycena capillaripes]